MRHYAPTCSDFRHQRSVGPGSNDIPQSLKERVLSLKQPLISETGEGVATGDYVLAHVGVKLFVASVKRLLEEGESDYPGAVVSYWAWPGRHCSVFIEQSVTYNHPYALMLCKLDGPTDISNSRYRPKWMFHCLQAPNSTKVYGWLQERYESPTDT